MTVNTYEYILEGARKALIADSWMSEYPDETPRGCDVFDHVPWDSEEAQDEKWEERAREILTDTAERNGHHSIEALWDAVAFANEIDVHDSKEAEEFGHYVAMAAIGHGVSYEDIHDGHGRIETGYFGAPCWDGDVKGAMDAPPLPDGDAPPLPDGYRLTLDICTSHMPCSEPDFGSIRHEPHEFGYTVFVREPQEDDPEWIKPMMLEAHNNGAVTINFDCDAGGHESRFKVYEW